MIFIIGGKLVLLLLFNLHFTA